MRARPELYTLADEKRRIQGPLNQGLHVSHAPGVVVYLDNGQRAGHDINILDQIL